MGRDKRQITKNAASGGLGQFFKVERGETNTVLLLGGAVMATEAGYWLGGNGLDGLVFARFGSDTLPYLLIIKGFLTFLTITLYSRWQVKFNRSRMLFIVTIATLLVLFVGWLVTGLKPPDWFYFVLWPLGYIAPDLFLMQAWNLASEAFDSRQTKRLFPLITAMDLVGVVAGNFLTYPLAQSIGSVNLLLVWVGTVGLAFGAMLVIRRRLDRKQQRRRGISVAQRERIEQASILESLRVGFTVVRYYQIITLLVISMALMYLLYWSLYKAFVTSVTVEYTAKFPNELTRANELTGFFGLIGGGSTLVATLISLVIVNRLYARFGVRNLILLMPIVNVGVFLAMAVFPGFTFATVVACRFIHLLMTQTFSSNVNQTIYNLLPPEARDAATPFNTQGIGKQAGTALAGVMLLLWIYSSQLVLILSLGLALIYLLLSLRMRSLYRSSLVQLLREGQQNFFGAGNLDMQARSEQGLDNDRAREDALRAAVAGLEDPSEGTRRLSAELLGQMNNPLAVGSLLKSLAGDTSGEVRRTAISSLAQLKATEALSEIAKSLSDPDPPVRAEAAAALRELKVQLNYAAFYYLNRSLHDRDPLVRRETAITLYAGGRQGEAMVALWDMGQSEDPQFRREAATAYGLISDTILNQNLVDLMDDFNPEVRRHAAASLGRVGGRFALRALLANLEDNDASVREEVAKALAVLRTTSGQPLLRYLETTANHDGAMTALQALTLSKIEAARAARNRHIDTQLRRRTHERRRLARAVQVFGLEVPEEGLDFALSEEQQSDLIDYGEKQLDYAARMAGYLAALSALDLSGQSATGRRNPESLQVLLKSLKERYDSAVLRIVGVIGLLGDVEALSLVASGLQADGRRAARLRADAIEALENFGDPVLTPRLIQLLEGKEPTVIQARRPGKTMSDILTTIWYERDLWLQACVLHVIGLFELRRLRPLVAEAIMVEGQNDYLIEETGSETIKILDGDGDDKTRVQNLIDKGFIGEHEVQKMQTFGTLSTMSRIMFLQKVPMFANLRPEDLRRVALVCKERTFAPGDIICYEGDPGDELYIVVSGKIQVLTGLGSDSQRVLAISAEGDAVGELAILDDIPRSATLRAHGGPVRLLILSADEFKRILRERPEMAAEVIRVLSRMLRDTNRRLQETPASDNLQLPSR